MKLPIFQIDAFSDKVFGGNPACVVPLENWLQDEVLLKIAQENAVAETAFFVRRGKNFHLRWFTPDIEMDLCGHATLATAHCILSELKLESEKVIFETLSGKLEVSLEKALKRSSTILFAFNVILFTIVCLYIFSKRNFLKF